MDRHRAQGPLRCGATAPDRCPALDAVAGDTEHRLSLDVPAAWHGLHRPRAALRFGIARGPANHTLLFDDPPAAVRPVWNARGWQLPPVGQGRDIAGLEGYASIMLEASEGTGAAVSCFRD